MPRATCDEPAATLMPRPSASVVPFTSEATFTVSAVVVTPFIVTVFVKTLWFTAAAPPIEAFVLLPLEPRTAATPAAPEMAPSHLSVTASTLTLCALSA